jgi:hypothetical protein
VRHQTNQLLALNCVKSTPQAAPPPLGNRHAVRARGFFAHTKKPKLHQLSPAAQHYKAKMRVLKPNTGAHLLKFPRGKHLSSNYFPFALHFAVSLLHFLYPAFNSTFPISTHVLIEV